MKNFLENFLDVKFIAALIAMITGVMTMLNCDNDTIVLVTNIVLVACPAMAYVITTGILDWNKINDAIKQILDIIDVYMKSEETDNEQEQKEVVVGTTHVNKEKEIICQIADILKTVVRR